MFKVKKLRNYRASFEPKAILNLMLLITALFFKVITVLLLEDEEVFRFCRA